ncbi:MAG TPA: 3-phosphoshikimate 1-carboxyvinyltransferase [Candidatus Polarisedimenticolia bacterium]|nr:3-phosphoshikimate 1-carboxyvinyltransferase [Candidatus Polarisedimenticolia bacterium]
MIPRQPPESIAIPARSAVDAAIQAPPSKSLTIRAMAAAALGSGASTLRGALIAEDTELMAAAIRRLGIEVSVEGSTIVVHGTGGSLPAARAELDLGNAGTPLRLLTAICCLGSGRFVLDGTARMRQRPVRDLVDALAHLGVQIQTSNGDGCPPIEILARGLPGGLVRLKGEVSSQYLSALLLAGPYAGSELILEVEGRLVSRPYVDLTIQTIERFGGRVEREGYERFKVASGVSYSPRDLTIESDASSASYFFAAAAITGGRVRVGGIPPDSLQGDLRFLDLLARMGCRVRRSPGEIVVEGAGLKGIDADLSDTPDVAPTLAAVGLFAEGVTRMTGIAHLRVKESDRIAGIAACVTALGGQADPRPDGLSVMPPSGGRRGLRGARIDPRGDHRLAMAFAVAGLAVPGVVILDPACVAKSFPGFFESLHALA